MEKVGRVIKSINNAMNVLNLFTDEKPEWGISEISRQLNMSKAGVYGLVNTLSQKRFLEKNSDNHKYRLGLSVFQLGNVFLRQLKLEELARPILEKLAFDSGGETVHLCVLDGNEVVYIDRIETSKVVQVKSRMGGRCPAYCTGVGKAILAFLSKEELDAYLARYELDKYTPQTVTEKSAFIREMEITRKRGYSIDNSEHDPEVRCIGCPIFDHRGKVVASISIAGPYFRMRDKRLESFIPLIKAASIEISRKLGFESDKVNQ